MKTRMLMWDSVARICWHAWFTFDKRLASVAMKVPSVEGLRVLASSRTVVAVEEVLVEKRCEYLD